MNVNKLDLTLEEAKAILADERLILASREEVEQGQAAIAEVTALRASIAAAEERAAKAERERDALLLRIGATDTSIEYCQDCQRNVEGWLIEDAAWLKVLDSKSGDNLCFYCFNKRALEKGLRWLYKVEVDSLVRGSGDLPTTERDDLAATVAGLRGALERADKYVPEMLIEAVTVTWSDTPAYESVPHPVKAVVRAALAASPAEHAALIQAAVLRDAANLIRQTTPDEPVSCIGRGNKSGRLYAIEQLESEADRLEKAVVK